MTCPFKVGDLVQDIHRPEWGVAVVTELTERGFCYDYRRSFSFIPRWGQSFTGEGEVLEAGLAGWERAPDGSTLSQGIEETSYLWSASNGGDVAQGSHSSLTIWASCFDGVRVVDRNGKELFSTSRDLQPLGWKS